MKWVYWIVIINITWTIDANVKLGINPGFLNYKQHNVGVSVNYFFPFVSFAVLVVVISFVENVKGLIYPDKYKKIKLKLKQKNKRYANIANFN